MMTNAEHYKKEIEEWVNGQETCNGCPAGTYCKSFTGCTCAKAFATWELQEYNPIKHTRQEWADFTGMYPEKDYSGQVFLFENVPEKGAVVWLSSDDVSGWNITDRCIPDNLPWGQLMEPRSTDK